MTANIKQKLGMAIKLKCCYAKFMDQIVAPETSKGEIKTCDTLATTVTYIQYHSSVFTQIGP